MNGLTRSLEELGYSVPEAYATGWVDEVAGMPLVKFRVYLDEDGIDVDVFIAESPFQNELLARRHAEDLDEAAINLVSPEDLILLKLIASRPRDIADVYDILFIQVKLDTDYMRRWATKLGILEKLDEVLSGPPPI